MPASECAPRLNFLRDSASALGSSSPSTAAHLLTVHNRILHDGLRPLNQRQQEFSCGACGTIRKPETTKIIEIKKKKSKQHASRSDGATIYKCLCCHRRTVKSHEKEPVRSKLPSRTATTTTTTTTTEPPESTPGPSAEKTVSQQAVPEQPANRTADNANSKKRAKTRKQGGLQALLASKQQSQPASSSLDLFDFLQQ